mmetsp:Transcript_25268/g.58880  ORF Transcript_25268/g.58880 Transcript_25268/m.58880 type:complete len:533 (+) Transcript_25268:98-1696(+)|eukprot:CAMPEP_0171144636 /NCGR_PEP_ID=MMETSP0766_2-20121228/146277_1 /TAXON_ID=439317 /ORGANISM="Gambierdiscus australes, Strain CAWD 149" /LENGTH=532 /DNA_ID=CAMNT_0011608497 /DNA_START=83 /DNA_END=1681 /DNA_ORIENTATION=-
MQEREDDRTDDVSTALKVQQFMDEWYYRCIHSGLAAEWDRERCAVAALELFELQGVTFDKADKEPLSAQDDDTFIEAVVKRMPEDVRRTFEHFALQLQLVMSAASRVRCALDEGTPGEVARIMEEGDQGVNSQILKQSIMEATLEVGEIREIHDSWEASMSRRLSRLGQCHYEMQMSQQELNKLNVQLGSFGKDQNSKSKAVLLGIASQSEKTLMQTVFKAWWAHKVKYFADKAMHDKFQKEIEDTQKALVDYKHAQVSNVRDVLTRTADASDRALLVECLRVWTKDIQDEKENRVFKASAQDAHRRMGNLKSAQKENAKKSMMRLVVANDENVRNTAFQAWVQYHDEVRKTREFEVLVKQQQDKLQDFVKKKSNEAKGVLSKMAGSSDTGLMHAALQAWVEDWKNAQKQREMEEYVQGQNAKLASYSRRAKASADTTAQRGNWMESDNVTMQIFMNWQTEARLGRLIRFYTGQMDAKGKQLEAVQTMFKSFATQLEHGISTTPRTTKKSSKAPKGEKEGQARPPQMPQGAA